MTAIFHVIDKSDCTLKTFLTPRQTAIFMLGRSISNFIVVKSDIRGDRMVVFGTPEISAMEWAMEDA